MGEYSRKPAHPPSFLAKARYLRKNQTEAEKRLWECLRYRQLAGLKFRRQHPIRPGFILDFYCDERKIAIEIDGKGHETPEQSEYDAYRTQILNETGISVIRLDNEQVRASMEACLNSIIHLINNPSPPGRGVAEGRGEGGSAGETGFSA